MTLAIDVEGLSKRFGTLQAVDDLASIAVQSSIVPGGTNVTGTVRMLYPVKVAGADFRYSARRSFQAAACASADLTAGCRLPYSAESCWRCDRARESSC